jgi:predicted nucleic acid-binding Zn ribbon protein
MKSNPRAKQQALREWRRGAQDLPAIRNKSVGQLIEKLLPKLGLEQQVRQGQLLADWSKMVGPTVARHARPISLRAGILTVCVDNSMWLSELSRYQKHLLLAKVREHLGRDTVKDVVFRIDGA